MRGNGITFGPPALLPRPGTGAPVAALMGLPGFAPATTRAPGAAQQLPTAASTIRWNFSRQVPLSTADPARHHVSSSPANQIVNPPTDHVSRGVSPTVQRPAAPVSAPDTSSLQANQTPSARTGHQQPHLSASGPADACMETGAAAITASSEPSTVRVEGKRPEQLHPDTGGGAAFTGRAPNNVLVATAVPGPAPHANTAATVQQPPGAHCDTGAAAGAKNQGSMQALCEQLLRPAHEASAASAGFLAIRAAACRIASAASAVSAMEQQSGAAFLDCSLQECSSEGPSMLLDRCSAKSTARDPVGTRSRVIAAALVGMLDSRPTDTGYNLTT